jgi:hypothetical protein
MKVTVNKKSIAFIKKEKLGYYSINGIYHGEDLWDMIDNLYEKHQDKEIILQVTFP